MKHEKYYGKPDNLWGIGFTYESMLEADGNMKGVSNIFA